MYTSIKTARDMIVLIILMYNSVYRHNCRDFLFVFCRVQVSKQLKNNKITQVSVKEKLLNENYVKYNTTVNCIHILTHWREHENAEKKNHTR